MLPEMYTGASGMVATQRTLDLVANNLANVRTPAFRPDRPLFSSYLPPQEAVSAAASGAITARGVTVAGAWRNEETGALRETGSPFDVAIDGPGWFRIGTSAGERLTRNGSFSLSADGRLVTGDGDAVHDDKGRPIDLPNGSEIVIAADGTVEVDGKVVATLGLADADGQTLVREGETRWRAEGPVTPLEEGSAALRQGFIEESGVDATRELVALIAAQRMFEMQQRVVDVTANQVARQTLSLAGVR